jgi:Putative bacterial sensory transduction regulator
MILKTINPENISKETLGALLEKEDGISEIAFDDDEYLKVNFQIDGISYGIRLDDTKNVMTFYRLFGLKEGTDAVDAIILANELNNRISMGRVVFIRDANLLCFCSDLSLIGGIDLTNFLFVFGTFRELTGWVNEFDKEGIVE